MRRSIEIKDLTWARVKYQATLKHKKITEIIELLLTDALSDWENRRKL